MLSPKSLLSGRDVRRDGEWNSASSESNTSSTTFNSNSNTYAATQSKPKSSTLLEDCTVRGAFECSGDLEVQGFLEGDVLVGGVLTVGESGIVRANCRAESAVISGKVVGDLICSEKIELLSGAEIRGNIKSKRLSIQDGVVFDGRVEMPASAFSEKEDPLDLQMDAILGHEEAR